MPTLDPVTQSPQFTGPTRDMHALTKNDPVYRQERFQMTPKRLPVSLRVTERPKTQKSPVVALKLGRVPILVRSSNQRPAESGEGDTGHTWGVSDPGNYDARTLAGVGADVTNAAVLTTGVTSGQSLKLAAIGALAIVATVLFLKR